MAPASAVSEDVLLALERRGYRYDASTLPTFMGPLARAFYFRNADLTPEERAERDALFGPFRDGTRPLKALPLASGRWTASSRCRSRRCPCCARPSI